MHILCTFSLLALSAALSATPAPWGTPLGPPPDQGLSADKYLLAFCDPRIPGMQCSDIAAKITATSDSQSQAQVQRRYCFEGYKACKATHNAPNCNDALGQCMVGAWGCNGGGEAHAGQNPVVPEPPPPGARQSPVIALLNSVCKDDGNGITCAEIVNQVNTNHFSRMEASNMMNLRSNTGFCFDAYNTCKGQHSGDGGAWDNCNNSLSRCLVGSWNCNANGPPGSGHEHHHGGHRD